MSFYEVDDSTNLPGELISDRQIIYFPKKEGKQTIQLDSIPAKIPGKGIYLCIEYIIDKKYEWSMRHVDKEKNIDSVMMYYGAKFDGVYSRDFRLCFYNYFEDYWYFPLRSRADLDKSHGTIKLSARVSYCEGGSTR